MALESKYQKFICLLFTFDRNETFHPLKELEQSVHRWPWRYFHSYLIQTSSVQLYRHRPRERNRNEAQTQILAPWLLDQSKVSVFQWVKEGSFTHWKTLSPIESLSPIEGFPWLLLWSRYVLLKVRLTVMSDCPGMTSMFVRPSAPPLLFLCSFVSSYVCPPSKFVRLFILKFVQHIFCFLFS